MEDPKPVEKKEAAKEGESLKTAAASYLSINYWAEYFDVTQSEILERLTTAVSPGKMDLGAAIKTKPELYGPFWIGSTIIFCLFAFGNLSNWLSNRDCNFEYISSAATLIYG